MIAATTNSWSFAIAVVVVAVLVGAVAYWWMKTHDRP
jgi:ABC-type spermidine/putrescine transport system permease subunit II